MADDKLRFAFTKKAKKRQLDSDPSTQHEETDFILAVSDKAIERQTVSLRIKLI
jgi:hypothetical protein